MIEHTSKCRDALSQLFLVTTLMSADMERGLAERGLTLARAQVLRILGEAERMTQRDLAAELKVTPRNVTGLIDALEETGFVRRTAHPTDRRAAVIVLTPRGKNPLQQCNRRQAKFARLLFGNLPEADLKTFKGVLDDVAAKLTELAKQNGNR